MTRPSRHRHPRHHGRQRKRRRTNSSRSTDDGGTGTRGIPTVSTSSVPSALFTIGQHKFLALVVAGVIAAFGAGVLDIRFSMVEDVDLADGNKKVSTQLAKVEVQLVAVVTQAQEDREALRDDLNEVRTALTTVVDKLDGHGTRLEQLERVRADVEQEEVDIARQLELSTLVQAALQEEMKRQDVERWRLHMDEAGEESKFWLERQRQRREKTGRKP